jgi:hypothetical protein
MERGPARAMWACPDCGRTFANRNQSHTCARPGDLDQHFAGCEPQVRAAFDAVLAAVRAMGPVEVLAEKTRIALHARMSFAAFMPRRRGVRRRHAAAPARHRLLSNGQESKMIMKKLLWLASSHCISTFE